MKFFLGLLFMLACSPSFAGEQCEERAKLAGSLVASKYAVIEQLKQEPAEGEMAEVWRWMAFMHEAEYRKLGDSSDQVTRTAQLVEKNTLSKDWRIELLVYDAFFRELCEAKMDVMTVQTLDAKALGACFDDTPPGKPDYAACVRTQVAGMRGKLGGK